MVEENSYLEAETAAMIQGTQIYTGDIALSKPGALADGENISVVEDTTYSCAGKLVGEGKVAVLNFANAYHPGGGVTKGALAQEECLCRSSNLYAGLITDPMIRHYYRRNKRNAGKYGSDTVAYHPGVVVFKDDEVCAQLMDESQWFKVDVITCAAPQIDFSNPISDEELYGIHVNRGRRIIQAAAANGVDMLVLGAFGCGAFNNDPEIVAKAYRYLLVEEGYAGLFKKIVFAIKKDHNDAKGNYHCFRKVLEGSGNESECTFLV